MRGCSPILVSKESADDSRTLLESLQSADYDRLQFVSGQRHGPGDLAVFDILVDPLVGVQLRRVGWKEKQLQFPSVLATYCVTIFALWTEEPSTTRKTGVSKSWTRLPGAVALWEACRVPKVRHMSWPGHSCQTLTSHEDQNNTPKPNRQQLEGVQPESPRPVRARVPS
jgi:hypothetical protein